MAATKRRTKKVEHTWSGAGYVCSTCGAIKDTSWGSEGCPGKGKTGFDVWLYHAGAGWWLSERDVETHSRATSKLDRKLGVGNVVAGAVLPAGQPLGLFTNRWEGPIHRS